MSYVIIFFITSHSFYFIIWLCYIYKYLTTGSNKSPASETQIQWAMTYMNQSQTHCIYHWEAIPTSHMSAIPTWSNRMTSVPASEQKSSCCTQMQQWLTNWRERLQDLPDRKFKKNKMGTFLLDKVHIYITVRQWNNKNKLKVVQWEIWWQMVWWDHAIIK